MIRVLFSAPEADWEEYRAPLAAELAAVGLEADLVHDIAPDRPETIDYIVYAPSSAMKDFVPFTGAKLVQNLWAGVEEVEGLPGLTQPLARMVDAGLTEGMVEWCVGHVLRHHLGMDRDICRKDPAWDPVIPPLARERCVAVLGLGALGQAVCGALGDLNFKVRGWSRRLKDVPGVACFSGEDGFARALEGAEIVVLLLPQTPATENVLGADALARLAPGAVVINPGRGPLIDDDALLAALESGQVEHATLDVFRAEPLPLDHVFWRHPKVTVTPHIASATRAASACKVVAENIRRGEAGEPFLHLVDRAQGY